MAPPRPVPAAQPYDPRRLSAVYWGRMRDELAGILGADLPPAFEPRVPRPLRICIHADLLARYPTADPFSLGRWLARWTATDQYLRQIIGGGPRFDLDGGAAGEITADAAEHARGRLKCVQARRSCGN